MKRKHYEEGGDVEMTAADYDDERPEESLQSRIAKAQSRSPAAPKAAPKPAPKAAPKPAPKVAAEAPKPMPAPVAEAPKAAPKAAAEPAPAGRKQDFVDKMSPNNPLRKIRARGMGEELPSGPTPEDTSAAQSRIVERERAMRDRSTPIGNAFRAIRERGSQGTQGYAKGGMVSASRRADGCAQRGKTKGRMI
jgi:outer membrane biosynthesis protein TonB